MSVLSGAGASSGSVTVGSAASTEASGAVSVSSGVAQITSAFPDLFPHRVVIALAFVALVMIVNLRGVKESGAIFAAVLVGAP